jgi:hypothetical protein
MHNAITSLIANHSAAPFASIPAVSTVTFDGASRPSSASNHPLHTSSALAPPSRSHRATWQQGPLGSR